MELADGDRLPGRFAGVWTESLRQPLASVHTAAEAEAVVLAFADDPPR